MSKLLATKPLDQLLAEARSEGSHSLVRALGPYNLISLGIGAIIGAGIFVLTGTAAAQFAGPAITLSFVIVGIGCAFAGLCYAEFAAMIPISGSAYTYGYATLGEIFAWIIGWDLVLEYAFGAATVASGWIGTLLAFVIVCAGVWVLRTKRPDMNRPFKTPWVPFTPLMGILISLSLMASLPLDTWIRLIVWLLVGFVIYFGYSRKHSRLQAAQNASAITTAD
jgi:amino acid transporter